MEYRVDNIIKALQGLPSPQHANRELHFRVLKASWESVPANKASVDQMEQIFTVRAVRYANGSAEWLDWVLDL